MGLIDLIGLLGLADLGSLVGLLHLGCSCWLFNKMNEQYLQMKAERKSVYWVLGPTITFSNTEEKVKFY